MVSWITQQIGIKSVSEELKEDELGSIIIDLRDLVDGKNEPSKILATVQKIFSVVSKRNNKVILQCQAGISRSPAFMAAILVYGTGITWEEAIAFVKSKHPATQINQDLLDSLKEVVSYI